MIWLQSICIMVVWRKIKKKNWRNGCVKRKWEWKDPENGKNEKKWEMEGPQRGRIKKIVGFLEWKIQNFTPGKLQMGSVFGYGHVSFDEISRTTMHCMIVCKHLYYAAFGRRSCIIYQLYVWIYYLRQKWLVYFVNLELLTC